MKKGLSALLCVVALLLITSCGKKSDYRMAIPADAGLVLGIDSKSITEKSGMNGEAEQAKIGEFLKENLDSSLYSYAETLMKNPNESGLDLSVPVYFYYTSPGEVGLVIKVSDEQKVKALFGKLSDQKACPALESKSGVQCVTLDKQVAVAFNESALLLIGDVNSSASLMDKGVALLTQKEEQSFMSKKDLFKAFNDLKGDMTCAVSYGSIMPAQYMDIMKSSLPENLKLSDINVLLSLNFEQGKIVIKGTSFFLGDEAKEWAKKSEAVVMPLKGLFLPQAEPLFWMGIGLKGDKLFDMLMEYPQYAQQMKPMEPMLRKVFSAIEGDFVISMPSMVQGAVEMCVNVELKKGQEKDFFTTISGLIQSLGMPLSSAGENAYNLTLPGGKLTFGLDKDSRFYLTFKNMDTEAVEAAPVDWTKEVAGNLVYYRFDFGKLVSSLAPFMASQQNMQCLELFDYIDVKTKDNTTVLIEVVMKNQDENVLKQFIDIAKSLNE